MIRKPILLSFMMLALASCAGDPPASPTAAERSSTSGTVVTVIPLTLATPAPTATPAATAAPTAAPTTAPRAEANPIAYVRVALFGVSCPGNGPKPDNLLGLVPLGCKGAVTATPKKADGRDVRAEDHGPDITWDLIHGERLVEVKPYPDQPFNREIVPHRPGPFMLCATVRGVMGCLNGEVTN